MTTLPIDTRLFMNVEAIVALVHTGTTHADVERMIAYGWGL